MSLADKVKDGINSAIIFLKGEKKLESSHKPLYTKEELKELYSIKKDREKYPERSEE